MQIKIEDIRAGDVIFISKSIRTAILLCIAKPFQFTPAGAHLAAMSLDSETPFDGMFAKNHYISFSDKIFKIN